MNYKSFIEIPGPETIFKRVYLGRINIKKLLYNLTPGPSAWERGTERRDMRTVLLG
jgi:hypothetical protein